MTLNLFVLWVSFFSSRVLHVKSQSELFIPYFSNFSVGCLKGFKNMKSQAVLLLTALGKNAYMHAKKRTTP